MIATRGWTAFRLAVLIGVFNFYCWFLHYPMCRLLGWEYKWNSGAPGFGTVCLVIAIPCLSGVAGFWKLALAVAIFDTGGLPWSAGVVLFHSLHDYRSRHRSKKDPTVSPK